MRPSPADIPSFDEQTAEMKAELAEFLSPWQLDYMLLRSRVAQELTAPQRILEILARDKALIVRHSVAHNPMATPEIADIAMGPMIAEVITQEWHAWKELRYKYSQLPTEILVDLLTYKPISPFYSARYWPSVIRALPRGYQLPEWTINELLVSGATRVHLTLVKRPDLLVTERDWWTLCQIADPEVQQAIQDSALIPHNVKVFAAKAGGRF